MSVRERALPMVGGASDARRLRGSIRALVRRFSVSERADVSCCGVTVAQAATLEVLRAAGPQRLGAVGRRLGIAPSTLTRNLARLDQDGLVSRVLDPDDARACLVALTPRGRRAAEQLEIQEEHFAADVLARVSIEHRGIILDALTHLVQAVHDATESCCPGAYDHLVECCAPQPTHTEESS